MPRPPRIQYPGAIFHVTVRGDNREPTFVDEADRTEYLRVLRHYKTELAFCWYAYALMTNHVHLLICPGESASISQIMQRLNAVYTKYFNRRYDRVGHLYQGRFHSTLIETDSQLLEVTRYIHLNPVKAGMVRHPAAYRWSSYSHYIYPAERSPRLLDSKFILGLLDVDPERARAAYQSFVEDGLGVRHHAGRSV